MIERDRNDAIRWAIDALAQGFIIIDVETTGLRNADIVEIGILSSTDDVLLDKRIKPTKAIEKKATQVHGITSAMLKDAPAFAAVYPEIAAATNGQHVVIYNLGFDMPIIRRLIKRDKLPALQPASETCAMLTYAAYYGDYSKSHRSYRWQPLPGGDHSAIGDCRATLQLIRTMATSTEA